MKKVLLSSAVALIAIAGISSCSKTEDNGPAQEVESKDIDYTQENAANWHNYMVQVAKLLKNDAVSLYRSWSESYEGGKPFATIFRDHNSNGYTSALNCIEEIIDGCSDIANEVGEAKIGDPYDLYVGGKREEALYAVESWYSWHSREDYSNNIYSVRNSYYGSLDGSVNSRSMASLVSELNPELDSKVRAAIDAAAKAILDIPQPFRNNINSSEASRAMSACGELDQVFSNELKGWFGDLDGHETELQAIVENWVDVVVLPTYKLLMERNEALLKAVQNLNSERSDAAFEAACNAWLSSREPWEKSEAFLFGPVDALGLDPNMDSWPLDQDAIVAHLTSGDFSDLNWNEDDDDDRVEAAQNVRGFHTLEFLLFKDGKPRRTK